MTDDVTAELPVVVESTSARLRRVEAELEAARQVIAERGEAYMFNAADPDVREHVHCGDAYEPGELVTTRDAGGRKRLWTVQPDGSPIPYGTKEHPPA